MSHPPSPASSVMAIKCLALDGAAGVALTLLADHGITAVLLKGPGLARVLRTEHHRHYTDVDVLVAPNAFAAAQQLLLGNGYSPVLAGARADDCPWHERSWQTPGPWPLTIDLHRGFAGVTDPAAFFRELAGSAESLMLAGCPVAVPDDAGAALVVALHAANPGRSQRPRADLVRALEVLPPARWAAAAELARRVGAEPAFALGLRQTAPGAELAATLRLPDHARTYQRIIARHGSPAARAWAVLAARPTVRAKIRHFVTRLLPSPAAMRHAYPLARSGPAGLALAYANRVLGYAWHTPSGLREVRAHRRRGPGGGWHALLVASWSAWCCHRVRRQLRRAGLDHVRLPPPPRPAEQDRRVVVAVLRRMGASCLERSLVRQRWEAGRRHSRALVIGVTAPSSGFHAHAWLEGDADAGATSMVELLRRPPPPGWLAHDR